MTAPKTGVSTLARRPRRQLALTGVAACASLLLGVAAQAEDSQPLSSRMMQMLGLGGETGNPPEAEAKPKPQEPAADPLAGGTPIPGTNVVIVGGGPAQNRVLRMLGLASGDEPAPAKKPPAGLEDCPDVVFEGAGAEMRSPAGADASSVAYQISITRSARECALSGQNVAVRLGLLGAAMLGPAGKPGAYYGSLRVALRKKSDNQLFGAKTYRVGAAIAANSSRADFTLLVEDLSAPVVSARAAEDYEVVVGFTQGGADAADGEKKPRRKKRGG